MNFNSLLYWLCEHDKNKWKWSYKNFLMATLIKNIASWPMKIERNKITFYCLPQIIVYFLFVCLPSPPNLTAVLCRLRKSFSDIKSQHGPLETLSLPSLHSAFNTKKNRFHFEESQQTVKSSQFFLKCLNHRRR